MRGTRLFFSIAMALVTAGAGRLVAGTFGTVVPIGGTPADIALDEARGVLYIADFGCACIDIMSLSDKTIHNSINVAPFPAGVALSRSGQYLVSVHYAGISSATAVVPAEGGNLVTVIDLNNNQAQTTYTLGASPLGVSFVNTPNGDQDGLAIIPTSTNVIALDPETGEINVLITMDQLALTIPQPAPWYPGQFTQAAVGTSADGWTAWVVYGGGTGTQPMFWFNAFNSTSGSGGWITTPPLQPRISVSGDGTHAMIGWAQFDQNFTMTAQYPNNVLLKNVTGYAWDTVHNILYAQIPDAAMATTTPLATSNQSSPIATPLPALLIMDSDNLTFRERLTLRENLVGRGIMNAAETVMYVVSDSGVTVLPVGSLNQYNRVEPGQEDVLVQTSFCNQGQVSQTFTLADPGGNSTDFELVPSNPGVLVSPSSGVTPATITVTADATAFKNALGTTVVPVKIFSASAVNQPIPVRALVSNPDEDQRGTVVNVPGVLSDILPDPARNRFYITRQDRNQVLMYDATTNKQIATLRTGTTPLGMAMTLDQNYLLVANADSQLVSVFDLNALQPVAPITMQGSDFPRSIAVSNSAILALSKNGLTLTGDVDVLDMNTRIGTSLPTLGPWANNVSQVPLKGVVTASPNGANILLAGADGHVYLYSAAANSFVAARQDYTALSGSYGASSYDNYVVGSAYLNSSLVPVGAFNTAGGDPSGFAFIDQNNVASGYFTTTPNPSSPGTIQFFSPLASASESPIPMVEAPILPSSGSVPTGCVTCAANTASVYPSPDGTVSNNGSGSNDADQLTSFIRTVAPLPGANEIVVLTTSGFTVLSQNYAASFVPPVIASIVNAANGTAPVAPGGLITVWGTNMSPVSLVASQVPLPTALGQSCLSVNGTPVPLLFVSPTQVNAQLPNNVLGPSTVSIHTPGGVSNSTHFTVQSAAPAVFLSGSAGPVTGLATIVRAANNQIVTPTNPIRPGDTLVIYLTGMGATTPAVAAGQASPAAPLALAATVPTVTLGGSQLTVQYAGLAPGEVGVDQINVLVPSGVTQGLSEPLIINQGSSSGFSITLNERVVAN